MADKLHIDLPRRHRRIALGQTAGQTRLTTSSRLPKALPTRRRFDCPKNCSAAGLT
jgi:hypothetical protein